MWGWNKALGVGVTKEPKSVAFTRRGVLAAFAATVVSVAPTFPQAAGFLRGAGNIRRLSMYSGRTGETLNTIYWIDDKYIDEAVHEISVFMRDWRANSVKTIDHRTLDIMAASHNVMNVSEPYIMLSGYRSAKTNAMLRRRSSGVARNSLHMKGQAADLRLKSRSVTQMARAALSCRAGGVGKYRNANFVHMDCGDVRSWSR